MKFTSHIGLDIGSQAIKLVQLNQNAPGKFGLVALGQIVSPPENEDQVENNRLKAEAIKRLVKDARATASKAVISLPESQVYTRVIEMPFLSEGELAQAIRWQAEQYIPVPLTDVVLKHQVLASPEGSETGATNAKMNVLLVAAPTTLLSHYTLVLEKAGLETIAIETEILAVARALVGADPYSPATLAVHLGAESTTLCVLSRGDLTLTQSIESGGVAIARSVASELGLDISQAEEYQKSYGLDESKLEGKVTAAIKPIIELILSEVKRVLAFYETRGGKEPVKRVVLSGGTAMLPGLVQYFAESLGLEVQIGNPFVNINLTSRQREEIGDAASLYTTAVGLALKLT